MFATQPLGQIVKYKTRRICYTVIDYTIGNKRINWFPATDAVTAFDLGDLSLCVCGEGYEGWQGT